MSPIIYVAPSKIQGRGVFSAIRFACGETVELAPVLPIPDSDESIIGTTFLDHYVLKWGDGLAIGLGYASLYNNNERPNVAREYNFENNTIRHYALCDIPPNEELLIKYACDPWW